MPLSAECEAELTDSSIVLNSVGDVTIRGFGEPVRVNKVVG